MVRRIVKMSFCAEHTEGFVILFRSIREAILDQEGCEELMLLRDKRNPNTFFTLSVWHSEEHIESYRQSDFFRTTWTKIKPWFSDKAEAWSVVEIGN